MCVFRLATAVLAATVLMLSTPAGADENLSIDLSGTWRINDDLSDDPRDLFQKKTEEKRANRSDGDQGHRGGGGFRGGYGGGHFGSDRGGRQGGNEGEARGGGPGDNGANREEIRERFGQFERGRRFLIIQQQDDIVTMIYANGDTVTIVPDGKKRTYDTSMGKMETKAIWKDFALVVTTKRGEDPERTRHYRISDEGRLEVASFVQLPHGDDQIEIVTVYDEVKKE